MAGTSGHTEGEPIHMTLQEVRHYLQTLYSSSSDCSDHNKEKNEKPKLATIAANETNYPPEEHNSPIVSIHNKDVNGVVASTKNVKKSMFLINIKNKKVKDSCDNKHINISSTLKEDRRKKASVKFSFKQTLCNMFHFKKFLCPENGKIEGQQAYFSNIVEEHTNISSRALPPLPFKEEEGNSEEPTLDFATSIQRVKDVSPLCSTKFRIQVWR